MGGHRQFTRIEFVDEDSRRTRTENNIMKFACGLVYIAVVFASAVHSIKLREYKHRNIVYELGFDNSHRPHTETAQMFEYYFTCIL